MPLVLCSLIFLFCMMRLPPTSTLFPYTTLFRSNPGYFELVVINLQVPSAPAIVGRVAVAGGNDVKVVGSRSEEHTSELQSLRQVVCSLVLAKKVRTVDTPGFAQGVAVGNGYAYV